MSAAEIEEMNRLRKSMGLAPLPVPSANDSSESNLQFKERDAGLGDDEEPASTLETREAAAYDNYKRVKDEEQAKKSREQRLAAIKKARDAAKRFEAIEGKGLGEADDNEDVSAKAWLKTQTKRQKQIEKARKYEAQLAAEEAERAAAIQYTAKDLAGVQVSHELDAFEDGDEHIMTLKDSNVIGDDDEGDQLENINLRDREKLTEKLELKKKKPIYDPLAADETGERSILAQYDEEIGRKKVKQFTIDAQGNTVVANGSDAQLQNRQPQKISLDFLDDERPSSDYLDISEIKVKKPKKKKTKSTRQRPVDEDDIFPVETTQQDQSMDIDSGAGFINKKRKTEDTSYADDEDLQATLAKQRREALKKRKRTRPEDIARQLREESAPGPDDASDGQDGGLVIDETTEFVSSLRKEDVEERKPRKRQTTSAEPVTAMDNEDEDETMQDGNGADDNTPQREVSAPPETSALGVEEEKSVGAGAGLGATLQLLRERRLLAESNAGDLNTKFRDQQAFLAEKRRRLDDIERHAREQREKDRTNGKFAKLSAREREEYARQQNNMRDQQTSRVMADLFSKGYQPNVELKYHDEFGRNLDQKEAFKHLSHQFHGKGSGKGKTDKRLKKIDDEKRRLAESMLDASQNVGMSSATAQQTKKRKEAGVRLA
ncbi:hypothetical protein SLS62_005657 [Diatrype stigma]|uniref:SART-1 protein n=1 Tax=Diatrype stigma TaxID=117547 RepID=A0AAN9UQR6_9PEZI